MTIDSVFILFKKTDFNTILAYLGLGHISSGESKTFLLLEKGVAIFFIDADCKFGPPC